MVEKKSVLSNMPALLAATGGLITAVVGLLTVMSSPAPSIVAFDASPNIIAPGESSILKWSVSGDGAAVTIEPDIGAVALSGNREVAPGITTNYTLTARNRDQSQVASLQLIVREKEEGRFAAPEAGTDAPSGPETQAAEVAETGKPKVASPSGRQQDVVDEPALAVVTPSPLVESLEQAPALEPDTASEPPSSFESPPAASGPAVAADGSDSNPVASRSDLGADADGVREAKAVRVITSADWNPSNTPRSENEFSRSAPIYAKLRDVRHRSALSQGLQDPVHSDSGPDGPDVVSEDPTGQDYLSPDTTSPGVSGSDPLSPDIPPPESADQRALSSLPA